MRNTPISITVPYKVNLADPNEIVQRDSYQGDGYVLITGWNGLPAVRLYPPSHRDEYLGPGWYDIINPSPILSIRTLLRMYWDTEAGTGCRMDDTKFLIGNASSGRAMLIIDDYNNSTPYGRWLTVGAADNATPVYHPTVVGSTKEYYPNPTDPLKYGELVQRDEWICIELLADINAGTVQSFVWTRNGLQGSIASQRLSASGTWNSIDATYFNDAVNYYNNDGYFDICEYSIDNKFQGVLPGFLNGQTSGYRPEVEYYRVRVEDTEYNIPNSESLWNGQEATGIVTDTLQPGTYNVTVHEVIGDEEGGCVNSVELVIPEEPTPSQTLPIRVLSVQVVDGELIIKFRNE